MTAAKAIKDILVAEFPELTFGVNLFIGLEPDSPPSVVTLFDISAKTRPLVKSTFSEHKGIVQIRVRNTDYQAAEELCTDIISALENISGTYDGVHYVLIRSVDQPMLLGFDNNNRAWFTGAVSFIREVSNG